MSAFKVGDRVRFKTHGGYDVADAAGEAKRIGLVKGNTGTVTYVSPDAHSLHGTVYSVVADNNNGRPTDGFFPGFNWYEDELEAEEG